MVSGVSVVGYKLGEILCSSIKYVRAVFLVFLYLSLISILLFKMLIVGIYFDINGMPLILCLKSVI